ncbi:hypothetical protein [Phenylobacterium sp.]|uniref:tyrosine phosphatase family protein n=1 Tax=Phenylobacterium sp. TaxID=1871053 RepID=UPI00301C3470
MADATSFQFVPGSGNVVVASLSQARKHKRRFDAVITLEDPACRPANQLRFHTRPAPAHLVLAFEDVDDDQIGLRVATREQVSTALEFGRSHASGSLLVHCFHGVGRSAAIALAIIADRLGPGAESTALAQLLALRPEATPNLVVVALADELLTRSGHLAGAVASWESTAPGLREKREARAQLVRSQPHLFSRL